MQPRQKSTLPGSGLWTLEAPACLCQQTLLNWPVLATLPVRIALIFGMFVLCVSVLVVLAILSFN